jgi:hypothetical protein
MTKRSIALIGIGLVSASLLSVGMIALAETVVRDESPMPARVLSAKGQEIGVLVNGQLRPNPASLSSLKLTPCAPAIDRGPAWAFCRDGFYFGNVFEYRKYAAAKRALGHYTGPVIIVVNGQQNQSFLKDGWLK